MTSRQPSKYSQMIGRRDMAERSGFDISDLIGRELNIAAQRAVLEMWLHQPTDLIVPHVSTTVKQRFPSLVLRV